MVDPSTPPRHSHPTPALSSPVTPPLPSTPTASHRIRSRNPAHSAPKQGQDDDITMPTPSSVRHWAPGSSPKIVSASSSPTPTPMEVESGDDFPSDEQLRDIQKALDGASDGDAAQKRDELKDMVSHTHNAASLTASSSPSSTCTRAEFPSCASRSSPSRRQLRHSNNRQSFRSV